MRRQSRAPPCFRATPRGTSLRMVVLPTPPPLPGPPCPPACSRPAPRSTWTWAPTWACRCASSSSRSTTLALRSSPSSTASSGSQRSVGGPRTRAASARSASRRAPSGPAACRGWRRRTRTPRAGAPASSSPPPSRTGTTRLSPSTTGTTGAHTRMSGQGSLPSISRRRRQPRSRRSTWPPSSLSRSSPCPARTSPWSGRWTSRARSTSSCRSS
mmetsp:Transcript_80226/g.194525  ORF Transcript_80226/g.194525 Transcript_80226/m.194525 type:complete len:214 (-) Transcript_80226:606-1247(-)